MITIEHLTYAYPRAARPVLHDISLHIRPGERVLLAGPSGAGKSTLLRVLNGLVPHFSGGQITGRVRVAGLDPIAGGPPLLSRHVGFRLPKPRSPGRVG
jgi:energy-coupling factor transport system ATP-binding protein